MANPQPRVMNFFEHQEHARKRTTLLMLLFIVAVVFIVVAVYFVTAFAILMSGAHQTDPSGPTVFQWWDPLRFIAIVVTVVAFIALASLYKITTLRGGGEKIAEILGARRVLRSTKDRKERRYLNVVEEMAIASGMPVPPAYLMDQEAGINAFAAGNSPSDAVVAVTRGALDQLSRDELQGVIAHEFSHIFNGDMRLNVRLIGIIFGILALGILGGYMLRGMAFSRRGKGGGAVILIGIGLLLVGYIGTFIGRIIQAAVSRQREFLADASSVQFTRNPAGISGALAKIGGLDVGSRLENPASRQASHMFFGEDSRPWMAFLLSTHPALDERIRRIDVSFTGKTQAPAASAPVAGPAAGISQMAGAAVAAAPVAATVVDRVGTLTDENIAIGETILHGIPDSLRETVTTPRGAEMAIYALLLDEDPTEREKQLAVLGRDLSPDDARECETLFQLTRKLWAGHRLPLVDLALPALRELPFEDFARLFRIMEALVLADGKVTLFEFSLQWLVTYRLHAAKGRQQAVAFRSIKPLQKDFLILLQALATAGQPDDPAAAKHAFNEGLARVEAFAKEKPDFKPDAPASFGALGPALNRLSLGFFDVKRQVIDACAHCAFADREVTIQETELLRLVSLSLDCPLPPFVAAPSR